LPESKKTSAAEHIAQLMREKILESGKEEFLGSEKDLLAQYDVSKPTFRQASRMLEQEGLLAVSRGVGGGYYSLRPNTESVRRAMTSYFRSRNASYVDLLETGRPLTGAIIGNAAKSDNSAEKANMAKCVARFKELYQQGQELNADDVISTEFEYSECLMKLANNPVLELIIRCLYQVTFEHLDFNFALSTDRLLEWCSSRINEGEAIIKSQVNVAVAINEHTLSNLLAWHQGDAQKNK